MNKEDNKMQGELLSLWLVFYFLFFFNLSKEFHLNDNFS